MLAVEPVKERNNRNHAVHTSCDAEDFEAGILRPSVTG